MRIVVVKTADRMEDEPGAEHDQPKVQRASSGITFPML